ncbi:hypothetical protein DV702_14410 [Sporosarcina sp. PTS2304]|uniref:membrane lipoprotein lipid attachment site-containing protein n=1 Tax=Sporosarcina sp. PTS2304 TaxID=2283194 RepID=UPI000E0DE422|nr:membrane lipoprotein lipid attachment site-containing protein [Sporosarcina sp. PTS2304]AXI00793.1 hypothetical protein DV702_14410 [Sporosarcina sp. PTS2304]
MKKILLLMITAAMLAACSNEEKDDSTAPQKSTAPTENSNAEIEEGLKEGTTEYDYASLHKDEVPVNAKVKFVGTVFTTNEGEFQLTEAPNHSAEEVVLIDDIRLGERTVIDKGTAVTVYGSYNGKNAEDIPVIKGIFIDVEE